MTTTTGGGGCGGGPVIRVVSGAQALAAGGALVTGTVAVAGWPVGATFSTEPPSPASPEQAAENPGLAVASWASTPPVMNF